MENKRFEHIITRYLKGKATPEEEAELLSSHPCLKGMGGRFPEANRRMESFGRD